MNPDRKRANATLAGDGFFVPKMGIGESPMAHSGQAAASPAATMADRVEAFTGVALHPYQRAVINQRAAVRTGTFQTRMRATLGR